MKTLVILILVGFSSCGQSKTDASMDASSDPNFADVFKAEDIADMHSPDLFDDFETRPIQMATF